jgi:uncharacterized membrane protein
MDTMLRGQWWTPLGLGVLAGMRSMSAPALVSRSLSRAADPRMQGVARVLAKPAVSLAFHVLALGELVADKLPGIPARVKPVPMVGRLLTGALAGASTSSGGKSALWKAAALGAIAALASTWAFYSLRKLATSRLHVPDMVVALAEDATLAALASRLLPEVAQGAPAT